MPADLLTSIVTILTFVLYVYMGFRVGQMRSKHGIKAPATSGHPEFDRAFRVHMNTLEGMVVFLPLLWLATYYFTPVYSGLTWLPAAIGLAWLIGRVLYMNAYMADPEKRSLGFSIGGIAQLVLLILALVGIVRVWIGASV